MPEFPAPKIVPHPARQRTVFRRARGAKKAEKADVDGSWTRRPSPKKPPAYAELEVTTAYSFLRGASHPEEVVERAASLGLAACAITDLGTLGGIVRAHVAGKALDFPVVVGARLDLEFMPAADLDALTIDAGWGPDPVEGTQSPEPDRPTPGPPRGRPQGMADGLRPQAGDEAASQRAAERKVPLRPPPLPTVSVLVYPTDRAAYGRLSRLLTVGKRRAGKGGCRLALDELLAASEGMLAIARAPSEPDADFVRALDRLRGAFAVSSTGGDDRLSLGASCPSGPDDRARLRRLRSLAKEAGVPLVATNDVHYHDAARRPLQDVLVGIREGCTVAEAGFALFPHAERRVKSAAEMAALFSEAPEALARSVEVARRAQAFTLDALRYEYPDETCPEGVTPTAHLKALVDAGAARRYPRGVPERVVAQIAHEREVIADLSYEPYFLTVFELVDFARRRGILCQGRGAAANSAVCYCLGITALDPAHIDVLFERFVSRERGEPPDIDIDFEHERREEVIQHVYQRWGRDRAALTAEVITYRGRSAVREVGKALGLSSDAIERLARAVDGWTDKIDGEDLLVEAGLNPKEPAMRRLLLLSQEILGFPRHRSQHVGGFVITRGPLIETVPVEDAAMPDRTVIEWDKDDIEALGILKVDVLGLGMLTCIRKAFAHIETADARRGDPCGRPPDGPAPNRMDDGHRVLDTVIAGSDAKGQYGAVGALALHTVPPEDPAVYEMICRADTVGVFQIESRAQMSMLPRLRPTNLYDLAIEVAIVRPGPIQGDMVHPYLRRRRGEEPVTYPSEAVKKVLAKTLGVPLFQEQAMALAIVAAGFTPGESDRLRRAMAAWKRKSHDLEVLGKKLVEGMVARGYPQEFADRCYRQIHGFSEYGFPESHAASFALIVYVSAWLKRHHPAEFAAALIDSQPMGFYAPAQLVRDAKEHGVEVRAIDVNSSGWDCRIERSARSDGGDAKPTLRLGMRLVKGLSQPHADAIAAARATGAAFTSLSDLRRRSGAPARALAALARADAFGSLGLSRRQAVWQTTALRDESLPLFDGHNPAIAPQFEAPADRRGRPQGFAEGLRPKVEDEPASWRAGETKAPLRQIPQGMPVASSIDADAAREGVALPKAPVEREVVSDYATTGLTLRPHPMSFPRPTLAARGVIQASLLADEGRLPHGSRVLVAGLVLVRQRPATASGILFMTLEDETGIANLIVRPHIYDRYRVAARHASVVLAGGTVEREGLVVHVLVRHLVPLTSLLTPVAQASRDFR